MTTQGLIEDAINRSDKNQLISELNDLQGQYAVKYILNILLDENKCISIEKAYHTDSQIRSILEMLP